MSGFNPIIKESKGFLLIKDLIIHSSLGMQGVIVKSRFDGDENDVKNRDFRIIIDFEKLKGVEFTVSGGGTPRMYRTGGEGVLVISVPTPDGDSLLLSGQTGDSLSYVIGDDTFQFGTDILSKEASRKYFDAFINYYDAQ